MSRLSHRRLRRPVDLAQVVVNFVGALLFVIVFFGVVQITLLEDEYNDIQDARDAGFSPTTRLQRAARAVCNDHPRTDGRELEAIWTPDGQMECHTVLDRIGAPR